MITETIRKAQAGDEDAFRALYEEHKGRIMNVCFALCHDRDQAEDYLQDTFLQAFRYLNRFRGDAQFGTWLHRIAVNSFLMSRRRKLALIAIEDVAPDPGNLHAAFGAEDHRLTSTLDRVLLLRVIESLPPNQREHFKLHVVDGLSCKEAAELMGCSVGNHKAQVFRAKAKLKSRLRPKKRWRSQGAS